MACFRFVRCGIWRRDFVFAVLAVAGLIMLPWSASAEPRELDMFRATGALGEVFDGYVRVRTAGAGAQQAAERINARRREIYERRAAEQKIPAAQVGRVYAEKIYERAPAGTWFLTEKGAWIQKK